MAVTGEGFFPLRSADGQDLFTRNGSFLLDEQNTVVNSAGQFLKVASVDSLGKADFKAELIPICQEAKTVGEAVATDNIDFAINFPAESLPLTTIDENNLEQIKPFNPEDSSTYAKSAAITIFDENGNDFLLTFLLPQGRGGLSQRAIQQVANARGAGWTRDYTGVRAGNLHRQDTAVRR